MRADPHAEILRLERKIQNHRYWRKRTLARITTQAHAARLAQLRLIAQMIGEGLPRERIRHEIIGMLK